MDFDGSVQYVVHDATGGIAELSGELEGLSPEAQLAWAAAYPPGSVPPPPTPGPALDDDAPA
jgi:hypothetical protein